MKTKVSWEKLIRKGLALSIVWVLKRVVTGAASSTIVKDDQGNMAGYRGKR